MTNSAPKESVRALLSEIIDYAGLFPPSQVSMGEAVLNYATYRNSNYNWMLGKFVISVARLDEFLESASDFVSRDAERSWSLSVVASEDIYHTIRQIEDFNARNAPYIVCDTVELRAATESKIENTVSSLPPGLTAYFELALDERLPDLVSTLSIYKQRAKIRTGGVTPDAFPKSRAILRFVRTCLAANVSFKATAGLHHALRCFKPLTYAPDAPTGMMHGFLNLFLATGFARAGYKTDLLEEIMEDEFEEAFEFTDNGVTWRGEHFLSSWQLGFIREKNIIAFGSCSFDEPITDLREIGLL